MALPGYLGRNRPRCGSWVVLNHAVYCEDPESGYYEVPYDDCCDPRSANERVWHVAQKGWATDEVLAELCYVLNVLLFNGLEYVRPPDPVDAAPSSIVDQVFAEAREKAP